jgi:hypothetical protein
MAEKVAKEGPERMGSSVGQDKAATFVVNRLGSVAGEGTCT